MIFKLADRGDLPQVILAHLNREFADPAALAARAAPAFARSMSPSSLSSVATIVHGNRSQALNRRSGAMSPCYGGCRQAGIAQSATTCSAVGWLRGN